MIDKMEKSAGKMKEIIVFEGHQMRANSFMGIIPRIE